MSRLVFHAVRGLRRSQFPGRAVIRALGNKVFVPCYISLSTISNRVDMALRHGTSIGARSSSYQLLRKNLADRRPHRAIARLTQRTIRGTSSTEKRCEQLFTFLHSAKGNRVALPWLLPGQALLLPSLDCKNFAILLKEMLRYARIESELWIGLNSRKENGHAWLELEMSGQRWVLDRECVKPMPASAYHTSHPYTLALRVF